MVPMMGNKFCTTIPRVDAVNGCCELKVLNAAQCMNVGRIDDSLAKAAKLYKDAKEQIQGAYSSCFQFMR